MRVAVPGSSSRRMCSRTSASREEDGSGLTGMVVRFVSHLSASQLRQMLPKSLDEVGWKNHIRTLLDLRERPPTRLLDPFDAMGVLHLRTKKGRMLRQKKKGLVLRDFSIRE